MDYKSFYKGESMIVFVIIMISLIITAGMFILLIAAKASDEEMEKIMDLRDEWEDDE